MFPLAVVSKEYSFKRIDTDLFFDPVHNLKNSTQVIGFNRTFTCLN